MMAIELAFVVLSGLVFGSFITLASYRLPRGQGIVLGASRCPVCTTPLGFRDLWPVLSWLASKGRCRHCAAPVSVRYPLIEMATASVFLLIFWRYGLSLQGMVLALLAVTLLIMIVADFEHYIIPDQIHVFLLPLGLFYHYLIETPLEESLFGLIAGLVLGPGLHYGYRWVRKKEGLGFGDVKFLAVAGLWVGLMAMPPFLFLSGMLGVALGLVWRALGKGPRFPFGPALAAALFLCVAFPETMEFFWYIFDPMHFLL